MTQGFTLSSSLNYLCFDFKFCCLTQSSAEIMTVWSSQLPGDSWSLLAGKCSTQNSYAEQISIFLHQMLVSRCHGLLKSPETPQEKIWEYVCGRPGDKNNLVVLWEGIYSLIRWCFAIPVQGTQSGGCYTGTSKLFPCWFICCFCSSFQPSFSAPLALSELTDPIPCPEQGLSPMGLSQASGTPEWVWVTGREQQGGSGAGLPQQSLERLWRGDRAPGKDCKQVWHPEPQVSPVQSCRDGSHGQHHSPVLGTHPWQPSLA